jgi:pimeloyl-ACP methyl ester carboxylesterase
MHRVFQKFTDRLSSAEDTATFSEAMGVVATRSILSCFAYLAPIEAVVPLMLSGGGVIASAVAERFPERVRRIAYVAGMMLPDGASYADIVTELKDSHPNAAGIAPHLLRSPDRLTSRVPVQTALTYFFHDCPSAEAIAAAHRLTPQPEPGRAVRPRLKSAGDLSTRQVLSNGEGAPGTG